MTLTMLSIETERFGRLDVGPDEVIRVIGSMPGFTGLDSVVLVPVDDDGVFVWVQSAAPPDTAFLAVNPFLFHPDYTFELGDEVADALAVEAGDDVVVYTLVSIREGTPSTNLAAPFVVNARARQATQVVLDGDLPLRAPLDPRRGAHDDLVVSA